MLPIQYTYLLGASLFLIPWATIYLVRKDLRTVLIKVGLLFTPFGVIVEYFWWTKDWWRPYTITHTIVGIEDIILGFGTAGVAACLYLALFKKKFVGNTKIKRSQRTLLLGIIIIFNLALFAFLFYLKVHSFVCILTAMLSASVMFLIQKRELILPALINGVLMLALVVPIYLILVFVTPTFVEKVWLANNLSGIYFLKVPIEDYIFFFLSGVLGFGAYPFYKDATLENLEV